MTKMKQSISNLNKERKPVFISSKSISIMPPFFASINGYSGVFHLASPCIVNQVHEPEKELLELAIRGTINVLTMAKEARVGRVAVTSSISVITPSPGWPADKLKRENCWTDLEYLQGEESGHVLSPGALDIFGFVKQELNNSSEGLAKSKPAQEYEREERRIRKWRKMIGVGGSDRKHYLIWLKRDNFVERCETCFLYVFDALFFSSSALLIG